MDKQHSGSFRSNFLGSTPHPSSPISNAATSTSPRLGGFGRRFRSPPPAPVSIAAPIEQIPSQARNADAVKQAKRYLQATVRTDWEYDQDTPQLQTEPVPSHLKDVDYVRREDGSSDPGSGPEDTRDPMAWTDGESNPYRYESPDAVAAALQQKKRKRRRILVEEMEHNDGLRIFHQRRNAWTGATPKRPRVERDVQMADGKNGHKGNDSLNATFDFEHDGSRGVSPRSASRASSPASVTSDDAQRQFEKTLASREDVEVDPLIPCAPPLLPRTNPVRAAVTPSMYPTIYSKVVVQSLTPSVPIPLPDITRAMVQGWREEGNWPPKTTVPVAGTNADPRNGSRANQSSTAASTARREGGMRKGVSAFRKALGLKHGHHLGGHGSKETGGLVSSDTQGANEGSILPDMEDTDVMFEEA